jgi:hypothetical protein
MSRLQFQSKILVAGGLQIIQIPVTADSQVMTKADVDGLLGNQITKTPAVLTGTRRDDGIASTSNTTVDLGPLLAIVYNGIEYNCSQLGIVAEYAVEAPGVLLIKWPHSEIPIPTGAEVYIKCELDAL